MAKGLQALFDAWDKDTGGGRDGARARQICHDYVAANPDKFADLQALEAGKTPDEIRDALVSIVDDRREAARIFREHGMDEQARTADDDKLRVDVWIMHRIDPQNIGGEFASTVRLHND